MSLLSSSWCKITGQRWAVYLSMLYTTNLGPCLYPTPPQKVTTENWEFFYMKLKIRESSVSILSQNDHYCARLQKLDSDVLFLLFCVLRLPGTGGVSLWLRMGEEIEVWAAENLRSGHCTRVYKTLSSSLYATTAPPKEFLLLRKSQQNI